MIKMTSYELFAAIIGILQFYSLIEPANKFIKNKDNLEELIDCDGKYQLKDNDGKKIENRIKNSIKKLKKEPHFNEETFKKISKEILENSLKHLLSNELYEVLSKHLDELIITYNSLYLEFKNSDINYDINPITYILCVSFFYKIKESLKEKGIDYKHNKCMVDNSGKILDKVISNNDIYNYININESQISKLKNPEKYNLISTKNIFKLKIGLSLNKEESFEIKEFIDCIFLSKLNFLIKKELFKNSPWYYLLDSQQLLKNIINQYTFEEIFNKFKIEGLEWIKSSIHFEDKVLRSKEEIIQSNIDLIKSILEKKEWKGIFILILNYFIPGFELNKINQLVENIHDKIDNNKLNSFLINLTNEENIEENIKTIVPIISIISLFISNESKNIA